MTPKAKATLSGIALTLGALLLYSALVPNRAEAAGIIGNVKYKVISIRAFATGGSATSQEIEDGLNNLSEQGWLVRFVDGGTVYLTK